MNPIAILALLFGGYLIYKHESAATEAAKKKVDDQETTNPMVADVRAFFKALNPSGFVSLVRFDDCDKQTVFSLLKKYVDAGQYDEFSQMYKDEYDIRISDVISTKLIISAEDLKTFNSLINGTITAQQQMPYTTYNGSTIPTGKTVTFLVPGYIVPADDLEESLSDQLPDFESPRKASQYWLANRTTVSLKTTGRMYKTGWSAFGYSIFGNDAVWAQLANDDGSSTGWVCVVDNASNDGKPQIAFNG